MNKKEFQAAREAVRQREDKRLREFGYVPESLPTPLPHGALNRLCEALGKANEWRGSYTHDKDALEEHDAWVKRAAAAISAVRKQNAEVKAMHKRVREVAATRMAQHLDADMARSRKSAGLEK